LSLFFDFPADSSAMGLRISQLLDPSRIVLDVQATKRTHAINEVARRLEGMPQLTNFSAFYTELLARERLDTTCIGNEIALPHARTDHTSEIVMAVGRSAGGVLFENSNQTVRLMFVLATPKNRAQDYLLVVGALCRLLTPEAFIEVIAQAEGNSVPGAVAC
jgi:mannitol/fructose-specific phosphotransferase system IIA component (Ntr-type)